MAEEKDLIQENEKLTARLKKAVEVFNEQKATIARQAEEIAALKAKAAEGENKDNEFFEQVNEITKLTEELAKERADGAAKEEEYTSQVKGLEKKVSALREEYNQAVAGSNKMLETIRKIQKLANAELDE